MRSTMEGEVWSLPEWTDLSKKLEEGAGLFVAIIVYALPGWACLTGAFLCLPWAMIAYHRCVGDCARKAGLGPQL